MSSDENFEDGSEFVETLDEGKSKKFIPIDRIQVVSNRQQYRNSKDYYVEVRFQDGDEYPTGKVDEGELLRKVSDGKDRVIAAAPGTWCIDYDEETHVLRRWPIVAWRILDKWTQPRPIMLDPYSFDPTVENFEILFPDGVVFRTEDESSWDSLEQYKESKHREAAKATEAMAEVELA